MPLEDATNEITGFEFLPNSNEFFTINQHGEVMHYEIIGDDIDSVSYTHLTLPTKA